MRDNYLNKKKKKITAAKTQKHQQNPEMLSELKSAFTPYSEYCDRTVV